MGGKRELKPEILPKTEKNHAVGKEAGYLEI